MVTTPQIAKVLTYSNYFCTFGGNLVCSAAGLAVLRVIEKERLQQNAFVVGSYLKERLSSLMEKHESKFLNFLIPPPPPFLVNFLVMLLAKHISLCFQLLGM